MVIRRYVRRYRQYQRYFSGRMSLGEKRYYYCGDTRYKACIALRASAVPPQKINLMPGEAKRKKRGNISLALTGSYRPTR